jgi:hypothetical protein
LVVKLGSCILLESASDQEPSQLDLEHRRGEERREEERKDEKERERERERCFGTLV